MKILRGTVFGGIAFFLLGWLVYGIIMMNFSMTYTNQCANKPMGEMIWWAMIASTFLSAFFLTLIMHWAGAKGIHGGLKTGAIVGLLIASSMDLGYWSMTTMFKSFWVILVDVAVSTLVWALMGMVIVLLWGKDRQP